MSNRNDIFVIAGETSGDKHGALLIDALLEINPELKLSGVAGPAMREKGIQTLIPMETLQVMGFTDVIKSLPRIWQSFRKIKNAILQTNPGTVVFIDYPDFNMRMAKALRKKGFQGKLVQYVCPTVWAWRKNRIKALSSTLDLLLTIFPFEKEYFVNTSLEVQYIGNPLIEAIEEYNYKTLLKSDKKLIGIFPGSRSQEIALNLPSQLKTAQKLHEKDKNILFAISVANKKLLPQIHNIIQKENLSIDKLLIDEEHSYELMKECHSAMATFGTVTLELAMHKKPTLAVYKMSKLNLFIARRLFRIKLPYYCIVNIIAKKEVFPELMQHFFTADAASSQLQKFNDSKYYKKCVKECEKIKDSLSVKNSRKKAAKHILSGTGTHTGTINP